MKRTTRSNVHNVNKSGDKISGKQLLTKISGNKLKKIIEAYVYNGKNVFNIIVQKYKTIYGHETITIVSVDNKEYHTSILGVSINENNDIVRIKVNYKYVYINLSYLKFNDDIIHFNENTNSFSITPSNAVDSLINFPSQNIVKSTTPTVTDTISLQYPPPQQPQQPHQPHQTPQPCYQQPMQSYYQQQPQQSQQSQYYQQQPQQPMQSYYQQQIHQPQQPQQSQYYHQPHQYFNEIPQQHYHQPIEFGIKPELQYAIQLAVQQSIGQFIPQIKEFIDISILDTIKNKK